MMTPDQLDNWFTYHPPTEETAPKYKSIRAAEYRCAEDIADAGGNFTGAEAFSRINAATRTFAEVIDANAPDSADKSAAIRCVRIARNCANEAVIAEESHRGDLLTMCAQNLTAARFQANSAIACGGK